MPGQEAPAQRAILALKGRRGCVGGSASAAGRHCCGACAVAGPLDYRRICGPVLGAANFAIPLRCLCVVVVGYDFDRVPDRALFFISYEPDVLAFTVYCNSLLLVFGFGFGRRLRSATFSASEHPHGLEDCVRRGGAHAFTLLPTAVWELGVDPSGH